MYKGSILRFRRRTGHAYTADALLEDLAESVEAMEWAMIRGIRESAVLLLHMAEHLASRGDAENAERFRQQAAQAMERSELVRQALLRDETPHSDEGGGVCRCDAAGLDRETIKPNLMVTNARDMRRMFTALTAVGFEPTAVV